jgi:DNA-binding SARP family transcriptional activator
MMNDNDAKSIQIINKYKVATFGRFDLKKNGVSLVANSGSSKKLWELYKFMLSFKEKAFTPESIADQLWVTEEYNNPRGTLRIQMHRLRQTLRENDVPDEEKTIVFANGYYKWNERIFLELDADVFVENVKKGDRLIKVSPEEALEAYELAIELYEGDYLPECVEQHWVFPLRNQYRRLFTHAVVQAIELMYQKERFEDILHLCQKGIQIDVYEEIFHVKFMETLLYLTEQRKAIEHYGYITNFYDREMGIKPSDEMKALYKKMLQTQQVIQSEEKLNEVLDSNMIIENAFYCEPDVFKSIYELERRRNQRSGGSFSVGVITVNHKKSYTFSQKELKVAQLKQHLMTHLRKGDTFTRWNDEQLVVLLLGIDAESTDKVLNRVLGSSIDFATVSVNYRTLLETNADAN